MVKLGNTQLGKGTLGTGSQSAPPSLIRQGKLAYWITVHKIVLRRAGIFSLGLVGGVLIIFGAVGLINYFGVELPRAREEAEQLAHPSIPPEVLASQKPKPLSVASVQVIRGAGDRVDAFAFVENPNPRIVAEFDYTFSGSAGASEKQSSFLLPGETRPLVGIGIAGSAGGVNLVITEVKWKRVSPQQVKDPAMFRKTRLNLAIVSTDYQAALPIDGTQIARARVTVRNNSSYGYVQAHFLVMISRAGHVVGISRAAVDHFSVNEEREFEATWIPSPGAADKVEVIPEINVFDPSIFLSPGT